MAKISALQQQMLLDGTESLPIIKGLVTKRTLMLTVASLVAANLPAALKGDPGGHAMAVGLFAVAHGLNVPVGTDMVRTSGHSRRGLGAAHYVYDPAVDAAYAAANSLISFVSSNGRGFRLNETFLTGAHFGAIGDGLVDDAAPLNAALDYAAANVPLGQTVDLEPLVYKTHSRLVFKSHGIKLLARNATIDFCGSGEAIGFELVNGGYPVECEIAELNIRLTGAISPAVGLKVRASYSRFRKINVLIGAGLASGTGIELASDGTAAAPGPYYNRFSDCSIDSQSGGLNHYGFRCSTGAPHFIGANANLFENCRVGSCQVAYRILGSGCVFTKCDAEFPAGSVDTIAFDFFSPAPGMCVGNVVKGGYCEGAAIAYRFDANSIANTVETGYGTGIGTWLSGASAHQTVISPNIASQFPTGARFTAASSDPRVLDHYEEGVFTPTLVFATPGDVEIAYGGSNGGTFTRIGNRVQFDLDLHVTALSFSTAAGLLMIGGFPFVAGADAPATAHIGYMNGLSLPGGRSWAVGQMQPTTAFLNLSASGSGVASVSLYASDAASGIPIRLQISGSYRAA